MFRQGSDANPVVFGNRQVVVQIRGGLAGQLSRYVVLRQSTICDMNWSVVGLSYRLCQSIGKSALSEYAGFSWQSVVLSTLPLATTQLQFEFEQLSRW